MSAFPFDVVAFDLDGTLADTAPDIAASLNHTLAALGRPALAPERIRALIGEGARTLLGKALSVSGAADDALVEQAYPIYLDHYAAHICVGTRAYPGVEAAMDGLAARGARLAICTNKPERLTLLLLDALGWQGRFPAVVGADSLPWRKPDPRILAETVSRAGGGRAAYVGDSITDVETARAAGLPSIAVSFGFRDRPAEELGADAVIDHFDKLVPTLERF
jgi:phosphoglycolate phosphatase